MTTQPLQVSTPLDIRRKKFLCRPAMTATPL